jgi:hypothetical protein
MTLRNLKPLLGSINYSYKATYKRYAKRPLLPGRGFSPIETS